MLKHLLLISLSVLVVACDNVNVEKYSESIQKCYNGIIYSDDNCNTSKRKIIKYCQCTDAMEPKINAKAEELNQGLRGANAFASTMNRGWGNLFAAGVRNSAQNQLNEYAQKLYDDCAKKTGYIRIKNCKKADK